MYYLNPRVENLYRIFDQNERKDYLRLDLNENPGGLPEDFIRSVLADVTPQLVAQYPETLQRTLRTCAWSTVPPRASGISSRPSPARAAASSASFPPTSCFRYIQRCTDGIL